MSAASRSTIAMSPSKGRASLEEVLLSEVIASIVREERSGDLIVESGSQARKIMFDRGCVGFAASNVDGLRFGDLLLSAGHITKVQLDFVLDVVKRDNCRIGEALVASGFLSQEQVTAELARQIRTIAVSAYGIGQGTYRFDEHPCRIPPELRVGVSAYRIQLEGIRQLPNLQRIEDVLGSLEQYVTASDRPPFLLDGIPFQPTEARVREIARNPVSIANLLGEVGRERPLALRSIYGLLCSGVLKPTEKPVEQSVERSEAVTPLPTESERGAPDVVESAPGSQAPPATSPPERSSANQDELAQLFTEIKIRKMVHDWPGVAAMLRKVVALEPDNAKYVAMLAQAIASIPSKAKEAEPHFRRALALDPHNAELHYEFGRYYQGLGMPSRALAEMKAALRLDPGLSKARSAVVEMKKTDESPITKSLKKIFS